MHLETNPHFLPRQRQTRPIDTPIISPISQQQRPHHQIQRPQSPPPNFPKTNKPPHNHVTFAPLPIPQSGQPIVPQSQYQSGQPIVPQSQYQSGQPIPQSGQPQSQSDDPVERGYHPASASAGAGASANGAGLMMKPPRKTSPIIWCLGAFCCLFWILVIVIGIIVLIVYFVFRPRSPRFDISAASLNSAYLDMNYLLNADVTILANFTNPSKKATVDFNAVTMSLYYKDTLIANSYVRPFLSMRSESNLRTVHLLSSQVMLSLRDREQMRKQMANNRIRFGVKGMFRVRSNLGSLLKYSYWLHGHCTIDVTTAPSGVLIYKNCITKR